jgi:hypothetical protein
MVLNKELWYPTYESKKRRSLQDQWSRNRHQQKVLHHMHGERLMIDSGERRTDGNPR